jgi:hypothetical protein
MSSSVPWLGSEGRDLESRINYISADLVRVLNDEATVCGTLPFQEMPTEAKRLVFLYNPTGMHCLTAEIGFSQEKIDGKHVYCGSISIYDPMGSRGLIDTILESARRELVPLLTLARQNDFSPLRCIRRSPSRVNAVACPQQSASNIDCAAISILVATFRANVRALPASVNSEAARHDLGQQIRLACAKRLLEFVREKQGLHYEDVNLCTLLQEAGRTGKLMPRSVMATTRVYGPKGSTCSNG